MEALWELPMKDWIETDSRIVIVEDDVMSCEYLMDLLASEGFTNLWAAHDGPTALEMIRSCSPDLILLDVMLPGMSGFEVCQQVRKDLASAAIPIILITALTDRQTRLDGLAMGANDFITKPIDEPELLARTHSLLRLKRLHDELITVATERMEFISQVSHELRTPLFAISGLTEMLLDDEISDPDQARHYLRTIYEQSNYLAKIVDELLDLSRLEQKRLALKFQVLEAIPFLEDTLVLMQPKAGERKIDLRLAPISPDLVIHADEGRLRQVLINLLNNAILYNDPGGWVEVRAYQEEQWIILAVQDNGWGISPEDIPHLFRRFYRGQQVQMRIQPRGAGLGLALAQEIIHAHGGEIKLETAGQPGRGSTFRVFLPIE